MPPRHPFQFSFRTLFVVLLLFDSLGWVGAQWKWICDRNLAIRSGAVRSWDGQPDVSAPGALRLFGESHGLSCMRISVPESSPEYSRLRNLFPEAKVVTQPLISPPNS